MTKREEEYEGQMAKVGGHFAEAENPGSALVGREMTKVDVPYVSNKFKVQVAPARGGGASANDARGSKKKTSPSLLTRDHQLGVAAFAEPP